MAYKFQLGSARLSGSTTFEQPLVVESTFSATSLSASAGLQVGGTVELDGVADATADEAADKFYILDATDGLMKTEAIGDLMATIAGDGLSESSDKLVVNVDDSTLETDSDTLRIKDNGVTLAKMAGIARGSIISGDASGDPQALAVGSAHQFLQSDGTDLAYVSMSGDATLAAGVLSIGATKVTDAMMNDDVATGLAGVGLGAASGVMALDLNELSAAAIDVSADSFALIDADDSNGSKKESIADLMTAIAGVGLKADAGVLEVRVSGSIVRNSDKIGISGSIAGDGLKFLGGVNSISALEVDLNEMSAGAVAVGADHFVFVDADDNVTKKESFADFATAIAGDGLAASSGVLAVGVDDTGIELNSDALRLKDNGVTLAKMAGIARGSIISGDASGDPQALSVGSAHQFLQSDGTDLAYVSMSGDATLAAGVLSIGATKVTDAMMNDDVATGLAGAGLGASSGVMAVQVTGAVRITSDKVGISGSFAGNGLTYEGGVNSISQIDLNANSTSFAIGSDELQLASGVAGNGLALGSHALSVDIVTNGGLDANAASSGKLGLDMNTLAAAAIDVGADSFGFIDAGSSGVTKKESIADLVTAMAGAGLTATSGVLAARHDVASKADGDTLAAGVNFFADLTSDASVTLPASPSDGDTVVVKAKGLSSATITINKAGSQKIDNEDSVTIESPYGAVTMVYVAANDWRLI